MEVSGRKRRMTKADKKKNDTIIHQNKLSILKNEADKLSRKTEKIRIYNLNLLRILDEFICNSEIHEITSEWDNLFD
jgi:hypothetical protein